MPCSRRPSCSTMTTTFNRTSGRISPASTPSLRTTMMISCTPAKLAITCRTRGSWRRASASTSSSNFTLVASGRLSSGSRAGYSCKLRPSCQLMGIAPSPPAWAIVRAALAASNRAGTPISSEYAKPVFSWLIARTPTPCSMLWLPDLT